MKLISLRTFLSALCILLVCHKQSIADQKPNIVFIFSDDFFEAVKLTMVRNYEENIENMEGDFLL